MGIKPANTYYDSFTFNGTTASTYGVYVTDVNVFDAPERSVEYISIPGRNGAFALDKGAFENITIEYSCAMQQDTESDFQDAISQFRNLLASAKGYCRLTDTIHTSEYRLACFSAGIEVDTANKKSATFKVEFECKPQRFLTSGETATAVASGGTINNPTLFDAQPVIEAKGYGNIVIGGETVTLNNVSLGEVSYNSTQQGNGDLLTKVNDGRLNVNDDVKVFNAKFTYRLQFPTGYTVISDSLTVDSQGFSPSYITSRQVNNYEIIEVTAPQILWGYWSSGSSDFEFHGTINYKDNNGVSSSASIGTGQATIKTPAGYPGYIYLTMTVVTNKDNILLSKIRSMECSSVIGYSTVSALGNPSYIDLRFGEAYKYINGEVVSLNNAIQMPAELPVLAPGNNTITYDNTFTEIKIAPRWWKV